MQLYKRCVGFIWESSLPLMHKLYVIIFFFSVRSTSLIANALFFTLLLPLVGVMHYTMPDLGIIVPWWSALLLPVATTLSVLAHTPRSLKYSVLYVLYENVLALHKAHASLEGMLGCQKGFKWPVTAKAGRATHHGLACSFDWQRLRQRIFVRELMIGSYLVFTGAWLAYQMQQYTLFWYYGIYAWIQGIVYFLFGLSVVDNINFEPNLPEPLKRPYRNQLAKATSGLGPLAARMMTSRLSAVAASTPAQGIHRTRLKLHRTGQSLSSSSLVRTRFIKAGTWPTRREAPGLPWSAATGRTASARVESFVHLGAHDRVASGNFVASRTIAVEIADAADAVSFASNYDECSAAELSLPPSPASPTDELIVDSAQQAPPPAGSATTNWDRAMPLRRRSTAGDAAMRRVSSNDKLRQGLVRAPNLPMPTRRHLQKVSGRPSSCSSDATEREPILSAIDPIIHGDRRKQLPSIIPGEPHVRIPRMRWRVLARLRQMGLSLPLWLLNGVTAFGIALLLWDLSSAPGVLLENLMAFLFFVVLLPCALIITNGQPQANTETAWASLQGESTTHQRLVQALMLAAMSIAVVMAAVLTVYTSSSRVNRWLRCELPWLSRGSADNMVNSTAAGWQCGDHFFS